MKLFLYRFVAAVFTILLFITDSFAQQPLFEEQAPPPGADRIRNVMGMMSDGNNCIWIPTQSGVYRFSGLRFRHFSDQNTAVIQNERMGGFAAVLEKGKQVFYMQDAGGSLYRIDSQSRMQPFVRNDQAFFSFGTVSKPFIFFPIPGFHGSPYENNIFDAFFVPKTNTFYLRLQDRIIEAISTNDLLNNKTGTRLYSWLKEQKQVQFATLNYFYSITSSGIRRWNDAINNPEAISLTGDLADAKNNRIQYDSLNVIQSSDKKFTFIWTGNRLYQATETAGTSLLNTKLLATMSADEMPLQVFYSEEQHLLIIYYKIKGLVFYKPKQFFLLAYSGKEKKPIDDYYYSLVPYKNGYAAALNPGLVNIDKNGTSTMLAKDTCLKYFLFKDSANNIWYQTTGLTIKRYNPETKTSQPIIKADHTFEFSGHFNAKSMLQANSNEYFMLNDFNLINLTLKQGKPIIKTLFTAPPDTTEFSILFRKDPQTLFVGSTRGLFEYNTFNGSHKTIPALNNSFVRAIIKIADNNYLVGTYNRGIFQCNKNVWSHLSTRLNNLPSSAHAFEIDSLTRSIWVSSNEGLVRLSLTQLINNTPADSNSVRAQLFQNLGPGILSEFNGSNSSASVKLSDTSIAFANAKGIVAFNPLNIVSYPLPVSVLIESLNDADNDSIPGYKTKQEMMEFLPVIPYFGNREELEVSYFLTNYDNEWHLQTPASAIIYRKLTPGNHTLKIRIRNAHDYPGKELIINARDFYIPYKWYQKTGYQVLLGLVFWLLVISLHNLRVWFIKKREKELELLVKLKTAELVETNDNLSTVIEELTTSEAKLKRSNFLKDEYYALLTHDLRSPLKFLSFNLGHLLERMPQMNAEMLRKGIITTYRSSNELNKLVDEFVYWIQDNEKEIKIQPEQTSIAVLLSELKKLFAFGMDANKNTFTTEVAPDLNFFIDANILFVILRNAVDNANKYTTEGEIGISASRNNGNLEITVLDSGRGMNNQLVNELMQIQYEDIPLSSHQKKSLGFYIMAMLIRKLEGSYSIASAKEKGTRICFMIPESKKDSLIEKDEKPLTN